MGIECRFVDPSKPEEFENAIDKKLDVYMQKHYLTQNLNVFPINEVSKIGKAHNVPLIMDNTAAPYISKPISHGAILLCIPQPKYIGGHGFSIGGLLIDGGNFDWESEIDRFKMLITPDQSYHGAIWTEAKKPLGPIAYILRARVFFSVI